MNDGLEITDRVEALISILPFIIGGLLACAALYGVLFLTLAFIDRRRLSRRLLVFLELTPPPSNPTLKSTQHLFTVLHGMESTKSLIAKILRRKMVLAFEIVSSQEQGIRYFVALAENDLVNFKHTAHSYMPDMAISQVHDPLPTTYGTDIQQVDLKTSGHFAYPLNSYETADEYDPIAYLAGAMSGLSAKEMVALQITLVPVRVREASMISKRLLHNEELLLKLGRRKIGLFESIFGLINSVLFAALDGVGDIASGTGNSKPSNDHYKYRADLKAKPARTLSQLEQQLANTVHQKLNQGLFAVNIRGLVASSNKSERKQRIRAVREWAGSFKSRYQDLQATPIMAPWRKHQQFMLTKRRLPSLFKRNSSILSSSEVATLYHFPHTETAKADNVMRALSKTLPAPVSLKQGKNLDVIIGQNQHHGITTNIGLTQAERERHIYILGGTGNGKTTLLQYSIVQDIQNGKGVAVIDPHGDMAETLLRHIPENRIDDVIYFNPDDLTYPIGLNVLELTPGLEGDELLREKDIVTESVISIFRKIFSEDDTGGHRIEYVLRNAVQTALTIENATLFTVYNLLNDPKYCKKVVASLENDDLKNFWKNELGKAGGFQQVKMVAGITAKIGRFLFSASAKRILEQPKSTINFGQILDGKILICNLSKGLLGEDTSELFGVAVLAKIQMAALQRARVQQNARKPYFVYVDEFQNFATPSFVQMLSESRKYKLYLVMAEQSTSQQAEQRTVNTILANVGTIICFRSGNPEDERLVLPLFKPLLEEGQIASLPSYSFYIRVSAIKTQEPFSGETLVLKDIGNEDVAAKAIEESRKNYATRYLPQQTELNSQSHTTKKSTAAKRLGD